MFASLMNIDKHHDGNAHIEQAIEQHEQATHCAVCGGLLVFMGRLGKLLWFRCRNCGLDCQIRSE